ncbi:chaperone EMC4 Ecym_2581 [Eremothecium cymbalariae DBVPG|uniref:ER membrane protein complex subunit 4 n=1 Tax=Eremothecium cymbalariae (strain CBS 270.75 / DBVPG 7215 / KCTC 17166 / NRRL Y-17582) TaxID=931890 RepID=G8JQG4_ERECY|nr:Hypothetical protein Ecym_2581 [Eremothecium cymbalariae DBVPG\
MSQDIPNWATNLCNPNYVHSMQSVSTNTYPLPPGFVKSRGSRANTKAQNADTQSNKENINKLQVQKAWHIALQPAKTIPMNFIISYMSGTSLQIIPIMTALMLLSGPIKSVLQMRSAFSAVLGNNDIHSQVIGAMITYVLFQVVLMGIGLQKLNAMGLIPNTKSDWLAWESPSTYNIKAYAF